MLSLIVVVTGLLNNVGLATIYYTIFSGKVKFKKGLENRMLLNRRIIS